MGIHYIRINQKLWIFFHQEIILEQLLNKDFCQILMLGLFFEKKDNLIGINFNKEFIVSENALSDFGFEQVKDNYTIFKTRFVKLTKNEDAELSGNISHEFKSNIFNGKLRIHGLI